MTTTIERQMSIASLLDLMKMRRCVKLRTGDVELELHPSAFAAEGPVIPEHQPIGEDAGMPTNDELLFASCPYPEDIKAKPPEEPNT